MITILLQYVNVWAYVVRSMLIPSSRSQCFSHLDTVDINELFYDYSRYDTIIQWSVKPSVSFLCKKGVAKKGGINDSTRLFRTHGNL